MRNRKKKRRGPKVQEDTEKKRGGTPKDRGHADRKRDGITARYSSTFMGRGAKRGSLAYLELLAKEEERMNEGLV